MNSVLARYLVAIPVALVAFVTVLTAMPRDQAIGVLVLVLLFEPLAAGAATVYQWRLFFLDQHRPRSWLFGFVAVFSTLITCGSAPISYLALRRVLGGEPLNAVDAALILAISIALITAVPILLAVLFFLVRRRATPGNPDDPTKPQEDGKP